MRFIINFICFGILFYAIYIFFPQAFETLVNWADAVFQFLKSLVETVVEKVQSPTPPANGGAA